MSYLQTKVVSHSARVRALYKEALRQLQSYYYFPHLYRYHAVVLRARFEENKDEKDMIKAKQVLQSGEEELFLNQHPQPFKFPNSPGGIAFARDTVIPDWIVDMWHPLERAQYPEYFKRREQRKLEFIERWEKKYGKPDPHEHH